MLSCCWNDVLPQFSKLRRLSMLQLLLLLTLLMSKQPELAHAPVLQTSSGFASQDPVENHPFFQDSLYSYGHLLTKISPLLSFLIPQITRYSHLLRFLWSGLTVVWCQAAIRGNADGRNQPMLLHHSTLPLQDVGGVPWIRWGNNFYFLLLFFTTFITFIILFIFSGTGPLIWFTAWPCEEVELGELRSGAVLHEDKKGGTVVGMFLRPQDQKTVAFLLPPWDESSPNF